MHARVYTYIYIYIYIYMHVYIYINMLGFMTCRARLSSHKEVLLVFDGDLDTCDKAAISSKLRHLKRLLAKRFEARHHQGRPACCISSCLMRVDVQLRCFFLTRLSNVDISALTPVWLSACIQPCLPRRLTKRFQSPALCYYCSPAHFQPLNMHQNTCMLEW
jgi:hypothetical protein